MFGIKKDDQGSARRKVLLDHLKNLEKQSLIQWSLSDDGKNVEMGKFFLTATGRSVDLEIKLSYFPPTDLSEAKFKSLRVSLMGNGILDLDRETAPKHWYWDTDLRITYLINRVHRAMEKLRQKTAEQGASEILRRLLQKTAS